MNKTNVKIRLAVGTLLLALIAEPAAYAQVNQRDNSQITQSRPMPTTKRNVEQVSPNLARVMPSVMPLGSEKIASFKTGPGWQYTIGKVDVLLPRGGSCLVTCSIDVQSHVQTGYLTFRTARRDVAEGANESDDGWAMDIPVPASQTSASTTFAWDMEAGQTYRFGCRTLADRGFLDIDV